MLALEKIVALTPSSCDSSRPRNTWQKHLHVFLTAKACVRETKKENHMKKIILQGHSTYDGAGVKLKRVFAHDHTKLTDPFLLLDHFGSDNPDDYIKGFPWHPHRVIETVTYMLGGTVEHGDNIGNAGIIGPGDIQWMTAGGGVIHQEMPQLSKGMMHGLQLWVNLPAKNKMMEPRYRGILDNEVPVVKIPEGEVRVIAGIYKDVTGPVQGLIVDIEYLDVRLKKGTSLSHVAKKGYTSFCYLIAGTGGRCRVPGCPVKEGNVPVPRG
jgi:redox-sensitive bicupin YhaK (pirin superfamily)